MTVPDDHVPYVLGQQRMTLAELRAELESTRAATAATASAFPRLRASIVVVAIAGGVAVVATAAVLSLVAILAALTV